MLSVSDIVWLQLLAQSTTVVVIVAVVLYGLTALERLVSDLLLWVSSLVGTNPVLYDQPSLEDLIDVKERNIALLIPVWRSGEGLSASVDRLVNSLDYSAYHVFLGVYPNDTQSLREAQRLALRHQHVHRVVCSQPGPIPYSDSVTALVEGVAEFANSSGIEFEAAVLGEVDDTLHPLSFRLYNYYSERFDLVEIPRFARSEAWYQLAAGAVRDDLAFVHGRENTIRAALSHDCVLRQTLPCVEMGLLRRLLSEAWVQQEQHVTRNALASWLHSVASNRIFSRLEVDSQRRYRHRPAQAAKVHATRFVAVTDSFPTSFSQAVNYEVDCLEQRSLSLEIYSRQRSPLTRLYLLWREFSGRLALILMPLFILALGWISFASITQTNTQPTFQSLVAAHPWLTSGAIIISVYVVYSILIRYLQVSSSYRTAISIMFLPRLITGLVVQVLAVVRSLFVRQPQNMIRVLNASIDNAGILATLEHDAGKSARLGEMLTERGLIDHRDLVRALDLTRRSPVPLGRILLRQGKISEDELLDVLADQTGWPVRMFDPMQVPLAVARLVPQPLMRRHRVFPIAVRVDGQIILATYKTPTARMRREIEFATGSPVSLCLAERASVRAGISVSARINAVLDEARLQSLEDLEMGAVLKRLDAAGPDADDSGRFNQGATPVRA